jgi:hypothetical protein
MNSCLFNNESVGHRIAARLWLFHGEGTPRCTSGSPCPAAARATSQTINHQENASSLCFSPPL